MNIVNVQAFVTIAASRSLSEAAEILYITQPALSHRLSALEDELEAKLLIRQKGVRTIDLTETGQRFLPIAKKMMNLWDEAKTLDSKTAGVPFRVANVDSLNNYFMPVVYKKFIESHKNCRLDISTLRSNAAYRAIENNEIDMALITNPHFFKKVRTIPLFNEAMMFICSKNASYKKNISPKDLKSEKEIYIPWGSSFTLWHDYWFENNQSVMVAIDNMSLFEGLLQLEDSWAVIPSTVAFALLEKGKFKTCSMTNKPDPRTCYVIYDNQIPLSVLEKEFIETLLDLAKEYQDVEIVPSDR